MSKVEGEGLAGAEAVDEVVEGIDAGRGEVGAALGEQLAEGRGGTSADESPNKSTRPT